jgi:hypothetical protein
MARYEFKLIFDEDLPQVARFLYEQQAINSREDSTQTRPQGDDLRWMLANPDRPSNAPLGDTLRGHDGQIVGMIIAVPRLYRLRDRRLIGLAAGDFYIDAAARVQGFFMLRRFFKMPHADFWFANSCNRQSGPLWAKCGAMLVPESDVEYLYPFRFEPLVEEVAWRKQWPRPLGTLLKSFGSGANLIASLRIPKNCFRIERATDLEKLAGIAERNRNPDLLQPSRAPEQLGWQYGNPPPVATEGEGKILYSFTGNAGEEGWFALSYDRRGINNQIRNARLVDVVWPEKRIPFVTVLSAIIAVARRYTDLLSIRGQVGLKLANGTAGLKRRVLPAPEGFLLSQSPPTSELGSLADFPFIDRY